MRTIVILCLSKIIFWCEQSFKKSTWKATIKDHIKHMHRKGHNFWCAHVKCLQFTETARAHKHFVTLIFW